MSDFLQTPEVTRAPATSVDTWACNHGGPDFFIYFFLAEE